MKHLIAALLFVLGCAEPYEPPIFDPLPTWTEEVVEIRMVHSEPTLAITFVLVGDKWLSVRTLANLSKSAGAKATIIRQSDGQDFLMIGELSWPIEGDNGERDTWTEWNSGRRRVDE